MVTPDTTPAGRFAGELRILATRSGLLETGLHESWRARRLTGGPFIKVCTVEAASLTAAERSLA
ncbi:hypothetical protein [Streptomyces sp. NPDC057682]|uniref:hypothetical protein n=1 Tax=Streptomyces sp. NPDC057682 TaxID=3346210 RepID=UPI0036790D34